METNTKKLIGVNKWKFKKTDSSWYAILEDTDTYSWTCSTNGLFCPDDELRIAKLIAAAPELLEALISIVSYGNENYAYHSDSFIKELKKCQNAINKATK